MMVKAEAVLDRVEQAKHVETVKLTLLTGRSISIQELKTEKAWELEEARARLAETVSPKRS